MARNLKCPTCRKAFSNAGTFNKHLAFHREQRIWAEAKARKAQAR